MTKNQTYLLIAIIAVLFFSAIININLYTQNSRTSSYWTNQSDVKTEKTTEDLADENSVKTMADSLFGDSPITIEGINNLDIDIDYNINVGFGRFIPLYKVTKFNSQFNVNWSGTVMQNGRADKVSKSGSLNIRGSYKITGLCSAEMAKQQIQNTVIKQVKAQISEDIKNEVEKIKSVTARL